MKKSDIDKIFNSYSSKRVINEAAPMQTPSAMMGNSFKTPTFNAPNANQFNNPSSMGASQTQTTNVSPNMSNQNMAGQIAALDQKLNNMTKTLDNITILLGKLIAPTGRTGTVAPNTAPTTLGFRPTA